MKTAKIIALWHGERQSDESREEGKKAGGKHANQMLAKIISQELELDYGMDMDLILIHSNTPEKPAPREYEELLEKYHNQKTKNGKIIVLRRNNLGQAFGAFNYVFKKYMDDYDYWFFTEDDWLTSNDGVMKEAVEKLNDPKIKFVCSVGLWHWGVRHPLGKPWKGDKNATANGRWTYARGGCGITSTKILKDFINSKDIVDINITLNGEEQQIDYRALPHCAVHQHSRLQCLSERYFTYMVGGYGYTHEGFANLDVGSYSYWDWQRENQLPEPRKAHKGLKPKIRHREKTVHVMALWGGQRAWQAESNTEANIEGLKLVIQHYKNLDFGMKMDLILVNALVGTSKYWDSTAPEDYKNYIDFVDSLEGQKTKNGKIIVMHKQNGGISNGSYDHAFQAYMNDYDYWLFSEDDRIIISNKVMLESVKMIKDGASLVATMGIKRDPGKNLYARGSCGVTSTTLLKQVLKRKHSGNKGESGPGHLPFCTYPGYRRSYPVCWVRATHLFTLTITRLPDAGPIVAFPYDKKIKLGRRGEMGGVGPSADLESFLLYYHPDIHSKFFKKASENIEKGTDHIKWYEENYGGPVHRYI